jgi:hypothetical protein
MVAQDTNSGIDVYERFNGQTYLLTGAPGGPARGGEFGGATDDGSHVFINASRGLVPEDTDGQYDVYGWSFNYPYPRPKGATPIVIALTTAFEPCTSPNSTHGAPLAAGSCSPPQYMSDYVTPGTADVNSKPPKMLGSLRLDTVAGNPATATDEADVSLQANMTDLRRKSDLEDYTGELEAVLRVQITDRLNAPGGTATATSQAIPVAFAVPCTATTDTTVGATCAISTSADTLVPGAVLEGKRAIWELAQVAVFDGGADGVASTTGDNTLFAHQGIFVP